MLKSSRSFYSIKNLTSDIIRDMISKRLADLKKLSALHITKQVDNWLKIDEKNRKWFIPNTPERSIFNTANDNTKIPQIHSYDDILDFELLENGGATIHGGLGRAITGGVLFGGIGAIVGGTTGQRTSNPTCVSLKIKITLKDMLTPTEYINLITTETPKNSTLYQKCEKQAQEILSLLQIMCESNKAQQNTTATQSVADEIVKLKQLLDSGIITKEEFEAKKKQLLGI